MTVALNIVYLVVAAFVTGVGLAVAKTDREVWLSLIAGLLWPVTIPMYFGVAFTDRRRR